MTTALVVYHPPEADAGVGLRFHRGWLVVTCRARHGRWLAPWIQTVIAHTWNLGLGALRMPFVRSCLGLMACAALVFWLGLHSPMSLLWCWLAGVTPLIGAWLEVEPR